MKKLLSAYLEGTLSTDKKQYVARQLRQSSAWQAEFETLRHVQFELKNEMPFMGRTDQMQLAALLPDILNEAQSDRFDVGAFIKRTLMSSILLLTLLVFPTLFMQLTGPAHAAINSVKNVPSVTNTPDTGVDVTAEAEAASATSINVAGLASPVPMPGATLEPSLEARNNSQQ